ncbi:uncharacterized protein LOC134245791 [Saccostrea cucullata]|uniref:uncharacterized protein LOC134245791 n=1 Tax=Saccostrea cuccullata TaxID=36930 RepID=UPI002ED4720A
MRRLISFVALIMYWYQPVQCQPRPECAPDNPNRPPDCPVCPREGCRSSTMDIATLIPIEDVTSTSTDKTQFSGLTTEEISKFSASSEYGASVRVHTDDPRVFFISASGLPDHETQRVNPNTPTAQNYNITILKNPQIEQVPGCVGLGMIGITRTGVAIYNPLAGELTNAVEGSNPETFDQCDGHASPNGAYHYHKIPDSCMYKGEIDEFIGVALDGFPIYGPRVGQSKNISEAELDKCHGKFVNGSYRYYVTEKFPYYLGCFKGRVVNQGTITSNNCTTDTSHWNMESYGYDYYLCHCVNSGPGGGGGGPRPECAPENPDRPPDCPQCPPEGCRSTTMDTATHPPMENVTTSNSTGAMQLHGLKREEIAKFTASSTYGASVRVHTNDSKVFFISASGLPDHETQRVNPNTPTAQNYNITILKNPQIEQVPGCVGLGMIGITRTGVAIYNPLAGELTNAVEGSSPETFDQCDGHASPNGAYHYHKIPDSCMYKGEIDEFIGVALDGFPIYGPRVGQTKNISEAELDKCHGKFVNGSYRYYVTERFPYYLGCFKGRVVNQGTITSYNCTTNTSHWNMESYGYDYYLCHCVNSGPGGGGGGPRPECAPENPDRPPDCPQCPPGGCRVTTPPASMSTTNSVGRPNVVDGHSAAGRTVAENLSLLSLFSIPLFFKLYF